MEVVWKKDKAKFVKFAKNVMNIETYQDEEDLILKGINGLKELFIKLKMPTKLSDFGFTKEDVEYMANHLTNNGSFIFPSFIPLNKDLALEVYYNCL